MDIQAELKSKGWIWANVSGTWIGWHVDNGKVLKAGTFSALLKKIEWE